jgi:hypothetical protein
MSVNCLLPGFAGVGWYPGAVVLDVVRGASFLTSLYTPYCMSGLLCMSAVDRGVTCCLPGVDPKAAAYVRRLLLFSPPAAAVSSLLWRGRYVRLVISRYRFPSVECVNGAFRVFEGP